MKMTIVDTVCVGWVRDVCFADTGADATRVDVDGHDDWRFFRQA